MFAQIIEGKVTDEAALQAAGDAWDEEVRPGAIGFEGVTGGVAADGTAITVARFSDRASAEANSQRPEQSAWFERHLSQVYDGEPSFRESEDVDLLFDGGSDDAGFVQIMEMTISDRAKLLDFEARFLDSLRQARPDLLGGVRIWHDDQHCTEVNYFSSEAEARANEAAMGDDMPDEMAEYLQLVTPTRFIDLTDPILR